MTSKFLNDIGIRNRHWAMFTAVFSAAEVNLMERQFLQLVDFQLNFQCNELYDRIAALYPALFIPMSPPKLSDVLEDPDFIVTEAIELGSMVNIACGSSEHTAMMMDSPPDLELASQASSTSDMFAASDAHRHSKDAAVMPS
jgi:hypothetical protein